ncbi:MAG: branched-chain amino acid ABC transporter permease [Deltaproteobacteria bacterium]|nr:MAG: branched-chain amino acid ABC transporter permease [Deltaproteobacteria bacterium]
MAVLYAQIVVNGLVLGFTYILLALGLTLVLSVMDILNFAHGAIYMLGAFAFYTFLMKAGFPYFLSAILAIVLIGFIGVLIERYLVRRVGTAHLEALVITFGLGMGLESLVMVIFGPWTLPVRGLFSGVITVFGVALSMERLAIIFVSLVLVSALFFFVAIAKEGRAMRAVTQNRVAAQLQGINPNRISALCFFIASALAASGGVITGPVFGIDPYMGLAPLLMGFTAMILGGLGSIQGCVVGGFILGFVISFGGTLLDPIMANIIAFALILVVLIFRPRGVLGRVQK